LSLPDNENKTHQSAVLSLESFAITDIILNMLISFSTSFSLAYTFNPARESQSIVKLTRADIKPPVDQTEAIIIHITRHNEIFLKGKSKTLNDLKIEIQSLIAFNKTRPIIFRVDKSVVFDRVVQVFDVRKTQE
jgi:biopolymer transport protein ExbD